MICAVQCCSDVTLQSDIFTILGDEIDIFVQIADCIYFLVVNWQLLK